MNDRDCEKCKHHTEKGCDSWDCNFERRMARKEIIEMLKVLKEQALESHNDTAIIDVKKDSFIYVMNTAINSLEIDERYELEYENAEEIHREKEQAYMQGYEDACKKYRKEPCEDAVSRQAVDTLVDELARAISDERCCISRGRSTATIMQDILDLPPVKPQVICPSHGIDCKDCPAYESKTDVLDKIRADVINIADGKQSIKVRSVLRIVDKYKAESEEK